MKPIRTAVIGAGQWGRNLIRNVQNNDSMQLVTVVDINPERLRGLSNVDVSHDPFIVLNRTDIEAVIIATPPETHFALTEQSLTSGHHTLCEKPLCLSPEECQRLETLATERGLCLMVDCTPVYLDEIQRAKESVPWERVEQICCIRTVSRKPRFEGELCWSLAPHDLAVLYYWLGPLPQYWQCETLSSTTFRLSAQSDDGPSLELITGCERTPTRQISLQGNLPKVIFQQRQQNPEPLSVMLKHFVDCICSGQAPLTGTESATETARILSGVISWPTLATS